MGPEDKTGEMVVYCDGQPVGPIRGTESPEITVGTQNAVEAAAALSAVWGAIGVTIKEAATALAEIWDAIMVADRFCGALRWAEEYNRPLAHRYHHTKKSRTRKKYKKRIMAWYLTEVASGE